MDAETTESAITIKRVDGNADAEAFVLHSWLRSYERRGRVFNGLDPKFAFSQAGKLLSSSAYYHTHFPELQRLIKRSVVALAVLSENHDVYLGWACGRPHDSGWPATLHYVYVKYAYRTAGVARALVREVCGADRGLVYTFESGNDRGLPRKSLTAVAEAHGMTFRPHPIPGVAVLKQQQESRR